MRNLRVVFYASAGSAMQMGEADMFMEGMKRHGVDVELLSPRSPVKSDVAVFWGHKRDDLIRFLRQSGTDYLSMEAGYIGDRTLYKWISLGWNGLNGRAAFPAIDDGGARWNAKFARMMRPWRKPRKTDAPVALLCGQAPKDAAIRHVDFDAWFLETGLRLESLGWTVIRRPHPDTIAPGQEPLPPIRKALKDADLCVTFSSNSGVDAMLAGVPAVAVDRGSMIYGMVPADIHGPDVDRPEPDRETWAHRLAWCQWTEAEIRSGAAWEVVATARPVKA